MRKLKNIIIIAFLISNLNIYSQQKTETSNSIDLSTSLKSFETLSNVLSRKDTVNLKKVVIEKIYKGFNFKEIEGLRKLGEEWKSKKASIYSSTELLEIVKVESYYTLLNFVREPNSKEWKFSGFSAP